MNRKHFLKGAAGGGALLMAGLPLLGQTPTSAVQTPHPQIPAPAKEEPAPFSLDLVKEFVKAGHGDFPKVKEMLQEHPNLIYAKFDWGNGDFEAAIEGAGHVGNKEIANYLIQAGSRVTLYVLTMLGKSDLVRPVLEVYPEMIYAKGPHGFTFLHHAKVGGEDSAQLYDWLLQKGLKEDWVKLR